MREQLAQLKNTRVLTVCGLMAALAVVLGVVATIKIGDYIRIGFSGLPGEFVSVFFGPVIGGIFWGVLDIVKYFIAPSGAFFPGFTLTAIVSGVIYGVMLYRRQFTLWRVFLATLFVKLAANIVLNTLWLNILYGQAISAILPARLLSNAIMLPIDTAVTYLILRAILPLRRYIFPTEA